MKIAIIGAGIYGCHIATVLQEHGHDITIFERENDIFKWASGNNQFRLHMGFHYPRDYETRQQSVKGFGRFVAKYGQFTKEVKDNYYIITDDSLIDYKTYCGIFEHENVPFKEVKLKDIGYKVKQCAGAIRVDERIVCTTKLKEHFWERLKENIELNQDIAFIAKDAYDYVIDCTYGRWHRHQNTFYEATHLCYIKTTSHDFPAMTFMDGNLCSIYPTEIKGIYTLSSVGITPISNLQTFNLKDNKTKISLSYNEFLTKELTKRQLDSRYLQMAANIKQILPTFGNIFKLAGHQLSLKTKIHGGMDRRSCQVHHDKNKKFISVLSGKLDTIFTAEDEILKIIK